MLVQVLLLVLSIGILYFGAEFALDSAEKIGYYFGLSPLVIGLLIVGFGTSLPEFFVSQLASYRGHPEIALGNIVGSNIANLFLILGISGIITTLVVQKREIKIQFFIHIILTLTLIGVLSYGKLNLMTLGVFCIFFFLYLFQTFQEMKKSKIGSSEEVLPPEKIGLMTSVKLILGFALLYAGGELLVLSGTKIGELLGVSSYIISAIFIAFGTSFPELVTALIACVKKKDTELITGNIIGSNIFNVAFVLGGLGIYDIEIKQTFHVELYLLGGAALYLMLLPLIKKNFGKLSGLIFLSGYGYAVFHWVS
jgi:cation:H+ antiporter